MEASNPWLYCMVSHLENGQARNKEFIDEGFAKYCSVIHSGWYRGGGATKTKGRGGIVQKH